MASDTSDESLNMLASVQLLMSGRRDRIVSKDIGHDGSPCNERKERKIYYINFKYSKVIKITNNSILHKHINLHWKINYDVSYMSFNKHTY